MACGEERQPSREGYE
uniref:Uncharacterized protein n=1 Tax=Mesocestoides corti TaxID=53468 RepID=A0A5K3G8C5_MESCO